jgi:hypothetical protein
MYACMQAQKMRTPIGVNGNFYKSFLIQSPKPLKIFGLTVHRSLNLLMYHPQSAQDRYKVQQEVLTTSILLR